MVEERIGKRSRDLHCYILSDRDRHVAVPRLCNTALGSPIGLAMGSLVIRDFVRIKKRLRDDNGHVPFLLYRSSLFNCNLRRVQASSLC